jgi:hypothetical protein
MRDAVTGPAWEDPPSGARGPTGIWKQRLAPLLEKPNSWARFDCKNVAVARRYAYLLKHRRLQRPDGVWEFTTRGAAIYARYLGPEAAA